MRHSPGKLAVEHGVVAGDVIHLALTARHKGKEQMVASVTPMEWLGPIDEANAARLAHCWNTHDELVEALTKVVAIADRKTVEFDAARAVLAKEPRP